MKPFLRHPHPLVLAAFGVLICSAAQAAPTTAYSISNPFGLTQFSNATAGFEFQVNTAITVTDLGIFDSAPPGLKTSHQIGIFDLSGNLLGSGTVASGTVAPTYGTQFRYTSIAPLSLAVGNYRIGAYFPTVANLLLADSSVYIPLGANVASEVSYVNGYASLNTNGLSLPTANAGLGFFGPNFRFVPSSAVPEISSVAHLSLLAFAGGLLYRRRRLA